MNPRSAPLRAAGQITHRRTCSPSTLLQPVASHHVTPPPPPTYSEPPPHLPCAHFAAILPGPRSGPPQGRTGPSLRRRSPQAARSRAAATNSAGAPSHPPAASLAAPTADATLCFARARRAPPPPKPGAPPAAVPRRAARCHGLPAPRLLQLRPPELVLASDPATPANSGHALARSARVDEIHQFRHPNARLRSAPSRPAPLRPVDFLKEVKISLSPRDFHVSNAHVHHVVTLHP